MMADARRRCLPLFAFFVGLAALLAAAPARAEPPIENAIDAACREVARSKVFSTPDPMNLGLRELGRRIYMACLGSHAKPARKRRPVRRRR